MTAGRGFCAPRGFTDKDKLLIEALPMALHRGSYEELEAVAIMCRDEQAAIQRAEAAALPAARPEAAAADTKDETNHTTFVFGKDDEGPSLFLSARSWSARSKRRRGR